MKNMDFEKISVFILVTLLIAFVIVGALVFREINFWADQEPAAKPTQTHFQNTHHSTVKEQ